MSKYSVGTVVFVPNAFDWIWRSCMTTIKEVVNIDGEDVYYADCLHNRLTNNDPPQMEEFRFSEKEIFLNKKDCDKYISDYYYGGLCVGCKYDEKSGTIWRCKDCKHCMKCESSDVTKFTTYRCGKTGILVGAQYSQFSEICKYYEPTLPQNIREYVSWENYDDILRNCEFNKECQHHKQSCHKTCTYERYMNELKKITFSFEYNGRKVTGIRIHRKQWIDLSFIHDDVIECVSLDYEFERNRRGVPKKECYPLNEHFDKVTKINYKTGEIIDV